MTTEPDETEKDSSSNVVKNTATFIQTLLPSEATNDAFHKGPIPASKWPDHFHWPPPGGLRHLIFHAETNGFADAFIRVGRSVLVDPVVFWEIAHRQRDKL